MQWLATPEEIETLRITGLATMAIVCGVRFIPGLQRHARLIGLTAGLAYIAVGAITILIHTL
jgi:hypothetical protein